MADEDDILRTNTQNKLRDTLLFLLGLYSAVRIGAEHYNLRFGKKFAIETEQRKRFWAGIPGIYRGCFEI